MKKPIMKNTVNPKKFSDLLTKDECCFWNCGYNEACQDWEQYHREVLEQLLTDFWQMNERTMKVYPFTKAVAEKEQEWLKKQINQKLKELE